MLNRVGKPIRGMGFILWQATLWAALNLWHCVPTSALNEVTLGETSGLLSELLIPLLPDGGKTRVVGPSYQFTPDDKLFPVYCLGCRQHIPSLVSQAGRGLCPTCISKSQTPRAQALIPPAPLIPPRVPPSVSTRPATPNSHIALTLITIFVFVTLFSMIGRMRSGKSHNPSSNSSGGSPPTSSKKSEIPVQFDLSKLLYAPASQVDSVFGIPSVISPTAAPYYDQIPGEFREYHYGADKKYILTRFYKDQCVVISIELANSFDNSIDAMRSVGFDFSGRPPELVAPIAERWVRMANGKRIEDIAAMKSSLKSDGPFDMVSIQLENR